MRDSSVRKPSTPLRIFVIAVLSIALSLSVHAMQEMAWGKYPIHPDDKWPKGLLEAVDQESRFCSEYGNFDWVAFHYQGNEESLSLALRKFAGIDAPRLEIIIKPGPFKLKRPPGVGEAAREYACIWTIVYEGEYGSAKSWNFQVGKQSLSEHPTMTIYVGSGVKLDEVEVPPGVVLIHMGDMLQRYTEGLDCENDWIRQYASALILKMGPFVKDAPKIAIRMLADKSADVRRHVSVFTGYMGKRAESVLPMLEKLAEDDPQEKVRKAAFKAIDKIKSDEAQDAKFDFDTQAKIEKFVLNHAKNKIGQ